MPRTCALTEHCEYTVGFRRTWWNLKMGPCARMCQTHQGRDSPPPDFAKIRCQKVGKSEMGKILVRPLALSVRVCLCCKTALRSENGKNEQSINCMSSPTKRPPVPLWDRETCGSVRMATALIVVPESRVWICYPGHGGRSAQKYNSVYFVHFVL